MAEKNFINSLQRGLKALETFEGEFHRQNLHQLTLNTGLPKTTVLRILRTLLFLNYIKFDATTKEYFLGPKVMALGYATLSGMDLIEIARPYLKELSRITEQNINLGILDGTEVVYVERITRKHLIKTDHTVGSRVNMISTAIGRAILANLMPDESERLIRKIFSDQSAQQSIRMNHDAFMELLKGVRQKGYAIDNEEYIPGIRCIGVPVFNAKGNVDAAINMPVFSRDLNVKVLSKKYAPMLIEAAHHISESRGFSSSRTLGSQRLPGRSIYE